MGYRRDGEGERHFHSGFPDVPEQAKMRDMSVRHSSRSAVAFLTALLLLLCQAASAAQACVHAPVASDLAAAPPCHNVGENDHSNTPSSPASASVCDAAKAVGEATKIPVLALAQLPVIAITYSQPPAQAMRSHAPDTIRAVGYSPPLSILHCRFLN
jgi:hypothetical protein